MDNKQIDMENNNLIAEFMNKETVLYDSKTNKAFQVNHTYHSDWNELHKVIDKIEGICIDSTQMASSLGEGSYLWYVLGYVYVCGDIDQAYKAVVEFINFYNNTNR